MLFIVNLPEIGGMNILNHENVYDKLYTSDFQSRNLGTFIFSSIVYNGISYYPGSEPGGESIAQRMFSAKNQMLKATFLFNLAHYNKTMALDYNCFIILIIFPDLNHIKTTFSCLQTN